MISKDFQKSWAFFLPVTSETNVTKVDSVEIANILHPIPYNKRNRDFLFLEDEEIGETKEKKHLGHLFTQNK